MMQLNDNITRIKGIADKTALLFSKASVFCINDLIHYFPNNYISIPEIKMAANCKIDEYCVLKLKIVSNPSFITSKLGKKLLTFNGSDSSLIIKISYFGMPYLKSQLHIGEEYLFYGCLKLIKNSLSMANPKILNIKQYEQQKNKLTGIYPSIKGISSNQISKSLKNVFEEELVLKDYLTSDILKEYNLMDINSAIRIIHFPNSLDEVYEARKRLAFDEFFFFLLKINLLKDNDSKVVNPNPIKDFSFADDFISKLPYKLTNGQLNALLDIKRDLSGGYLMNRLIQGDVGCGKTIIAFISCLTVIKNSGQAVIMAPTEVLARQHYADIVKLVDELKLDFPKVVLLVGSLKPKEKNKIQQDISEGKYNFIIGTHALIQDKVKYKDLKIAITDEQHRFGVKQRLTLMNANKSVNVLVMSATPIPRTLGLILYGDLDVSLIKDLPSNRLPIKNAVVGPQYRDKMYKFIYKRIEEGRQAYIICPMVEEGELDNLENVIDYSEKLRSVFPKNINIGCLHGKMKQAEKDSIMECFNKNQIQILVSTTVVEVGVNVPNASVIMIENAERFGLASLHQLRGRVGRGQYQSFCAFICSNNSEHAIKKLEILGKSNDGFEIANEDLRQRGPGDFFGLKQSGLPAFKIADIYTDADVLKIAKKISDSYLSNKGKNNISCIEDAYKLIEVKDNASFIDFHSICL